jgi:hypothetical protein
MGLKFCSVLEDPIGDLVGVPTGFGDVVAVRHSEEVFEPSVAPDDSAFRVLGDIDAYRGRIENRLQLSYVSIEPVLYSLSFGDVFYEGDESTII